MENCGDINLSKKKLLLVVYDDIETKLLLNDKVLNSYLKNKEIYCLTKSDYKFFDENIKSINPKINYLDCNPFCLSFIEKLFLAIPYRLTLFFEYMSNVAKSESSFQKFYLFLGFKESKVLNKNFYLRNKLLKYMLQSIGRLFNFNFFNLVYKEPKNSEFDYILFSRPDSYLNVKVANKFKGNKTKILTLLRNFDTPCVKRIFTVPSDLTLSYDKDLQTLTKENINKKNYGKLVSFPYYLNTDKTNFKEKNLVLFATAQKQFITGEITQFEIIETIYKQLDISKYKLVIRIHPSLNKEHFSKFKNLDNVVLQEEIYSSYNDKNNNAIKLPIKEDIESYEETLQKTKILFSFGSTIVYDAMLSNVDCYYLNFDESSTLYEREHLKLIIKKGTKVINSLNGINNILGQLK